MSFGRWYRRTTSCIRHDRVNRRMGLTLAAAHVALASGKHSWQHMAAETGILMALALSRWAQYRNHRHNPPQGAWLVKPQDNMYVLCTSTSTRICSVPVRRFSLTAYRTSQPCVDVDVVVESQSTAQPPAARAVQTKGVGEKECRKERGSPRTVTK